MWLDDDRDWALALLDVEADACAGCGQPRSESMRPENEYAYTAEPIKCFACATIRRKSRMFFNAENAPVSLADGVTFHVHHD